MSDIREMLEETAVRIFKEQCTKELINEAEKGIWPEKLGNLVEELGLTTVGVDESAGGAGGTIGDALCLLRVAGKYATPLPLAETLMANWLLGKAGMAIEEGLLTIAPVHQKDSLHFEEASDGWVVTGRARQVPFARDVKKLVVMGESKKGRVLAKVDRELCKITAGTNLAGEPRDEVVFEKTFIPLKDSALPSETINPDIIHQWGAHTRIAMMAGSLEKILELTVQYSMDRVQFGKPLAHFQAIQQQLAVFTGEVEAAGIAAAYAIEEEDLEQTEREIMMAKVRVSHAVGKSVPIAHQIHGAIGITDEYPLHLYTRRLWAWREEFGNEIQWADQLGQYMIEQGADNLWSVVLR